MVVDQLRAILRHQDVIARTYREIQQRASAGPDRETVERLAALRQRRDELQNSIRTVLSLGNQNGFMADELKRLNGELNSLERSIEQIEAQPVEADPIELADDGQR